MRHLESGASFSSRLVDNLIYFLLISHLSAYQLNSVYIKKKINNLRINLSAVEDTTMLFIDINVCGYALRDSIKLIVSYLSILGTFICLEKLFTLHFLKCS